MVYPQDRVDVEGVLGYLPGVPQLLLVIWEVTFRPDRHL